MSFVRKDGAEMRAMDEDMIEETVEAYASAAANVKRAGFDMCQVHGGHDWLLSSISLAAHEPKIRTDTEEA